MHAVTLAQVESHSGHSFRFLRFIPDIETLFCRDYVAERVRRIVVCAVVGLVIYDLVHFADRAMVPDALPLLTIFRLAVFSPFVIFSAWAVRRWPQAWLYDLLCVSVAVLGVTLPIAAVVRSTSSYLLIYQTYNSAAFLFFVIALRPRFPAVLIGLALMCLSHLTATWLTGDFDEITYGGIVTFYLTLSIFLAVGAYFLEQTDRRNFLSQLRAGLLYEQLESTIERDELTGLLNRRSLARIGVMIWKDAGAEPAVGAILLDIDHFKRFNDVHGHLAGDACIRAVSRSIRDAVDPALPVFRFGGEEILILIRGQAEGQVVAIAEDIRSAIEALAIPHGGTERGSVTASLGVAVALPCETTLEKLLQQADEALYAAKRRGKNMVVLAGETDVQVA
jgi:diguanylate cyclase (GGDEF)-like protein